MTVTIGSLCTGYGGLDQAVEAFTGGTTIWVSDIDKHVSRWLDSRMPDIPNLGDVKQVNWHTVTRVDWLTAGYPCQPFSHAGKQRGVEDERHIWPWIADAISILRPRYILLENVAGHIRRGLDTVIADLDGLGYVGAWACVRASDVGAPHQRKRVFIHAVADTGCVSAQVPAGGGSQQSKSLEARARRGELATYPDSTRPQGRVDSQACSDGESGPATSSDWSDDR